VAIDHPEGIEGITKPTEKIDLRVLWNFPGEEAITRLSPPEPVAPEDGDASGPAGQSAPAPIAVPPASQASRFSFSSLSIFERCGYRFYAERELGLKRYGPSTSLSVQSNEASEPEEDEGRTSGEIAAPGEEIAVGPDQTNKRYGPGNAVHRLLEWSSQNGWATPSDDLIIVALRAESLEGTTAEAKRVKDLVGAWLESDVLSSIKERGLSLSAELPFVLSIAGTMINGSIDLVATSPDGREVEIVDYKTNSLRGKTPDDLMGNYLTQRDIYALAVAHLGEHIVSHYVFLEEPYKPVSETYDASRLKQAAEDVTALLSRIVEGSFSVTEHPHRALCHDCPAFRLCPHPREIRERDSADPAVKPTVRANAT
jgi:ATP-dependent exoDNAse (exonuclease V) beta subunit